MQGYDTTRQEVPALSRTWTAQVAYRECGVVTDIRTYTVTISNFDGYTAEVDGKETDVVSAARILSNAKADNGLTLIKEIRPIPASMLACLGVSA